jgi:anti-anti-sigma factor
MDIEHKVIEEKDIVVIFPVGSFDMEDTSFFEKRTVEILEETEVKKVIFNMSKLNYLNSTALNSFIGIYNRLLKTGVKIVFCSLTKPVETLFNITSLKLLVPIFPSEWDAATYLTR